jgi:hypothetical protein
VKFLVEEQIRCLFDVDQKGHTARMVELFNEETFSVYSD